MATVYLGLGSNLGDRRQNLAQALGLISQQVKVEQVSSIYETEPVGYAHQPLFLNAVCFISTEFNPKELLSFVKEIEAALGRKPSFPNGPRLIDIDILLYDNEVVRSQELIIPHPRLSQRAFALVPLAEIASEATHSESGKTIRELIEELQNVTSVRKWSKAEEIMKRRRNVPGIC